jgi:hypothetical protein
MGSQGTIPQWKTNVQDLDISTISEADDALQASFQKSRTHSSHGQFWAEDMMLRLWNLKNFLILIIL